MPVESRPDRRGGFPEAARAGGRATRPRSERMELTHSFAPPRRDGDRSPCDAMPPRCHVKSASLNWSLNPRTRGSTSICRLQVTRGSVPGAAPVGRATRRCCPGRNASWMLADGKRTVKGGAPGASGPWFRERTIAHGAPLTRVPTATDWPPAGLSFRLANALLDATWATVLHRGAGGGASASGRRGTPLAHEGAFA